MSMNNNNNNNNGGDVEFKLAGDLKVGAYVMLKGCPSKITDLEISKTGKHGHTKVHYHAVDIFSGRKQEQIQPSDARVEVPVVSRRDYQVNYVDDEGFATLMDKDASTRSDVRLADSEAGRDAEAMVAAGKSVIVTLISAMGRDMVMAARQD